MTCNIVQKHESSLWWALPCIANFIILIIIFIFIIFISCSYMNLQFPSFVFFCYFRFLFQIIQQYNRSTTAKIPWGFLLFFWNRWAGKVIPLHDTRSLVHPLSFKPPSFAMLLFKFIGSAIRETTTKFQFSSWTGLYINLLWKTYLHKKLCIASPSS